MTARRFIRRIMARRSQLFLLSASALICLIATAVLTVQVFLRIDDYRAAQGDNVQWTVAKLEVEHAKYILAIEHLSPTEPRTLADLRQRFDVLYSRVDTLTNATNYQQALHSPRAREITTELSLRVQQMATIIDGSDSSVYDHRDDLMRQAHALDEVVVQLSAIGIAYDVDRRESQRTLLAGKLTQLIALSLVLLATLLALLALFWQLYTRYRRRAFQNRTTLNRLATIINTSQDAILVVCPTGEIIEGNRVADTIFGLPRGDKPRAEITDILFKREDGGAMTPVTADTLFASCADRPNLCTKLSARDKTGRTFPIELSANMAARSGDNVCICFLRDISQRIATEAEMRSARDKALAGERAKARFLGMISHEMRTPLNGILGALDLLDDTELTDEQARYTQIMQSSGQLVLNQINDALNITQADGDRISLVSDSFDLDALLDDLITAQQPQADAQGTRIALTTPHEPLGMVLGDKNRLHQVLLNLLSNAIKYTRDGQITIEATRTRPPGPPGPEGLALGDEVEFQIIDTGIGIDEDDLSRIFDDYVRLQGETPAEGTGLGLGIARHLVRLMGGTIGAESERNEGSLFWVRLPLPPAYGTNDTPAPPRLHPLPAGKLDVLVVEDNDASRFVLHEMLRKDGHHVVLTDNGTDGVTEAARHRFDLILMDINMPGIDGIKATRLIRAGAGASSDSRIVALTAHFMPEHSDRFRGVEIDGIYTKPLRRADLRELLSGGPVRSRPDLASAGMDTQILDQLCAVLPAKNLSRVLNDFVAEGQSFIDGLPEASAAPAPDLAARLHQFAGSAATFGAVALSSALCRAESAAHAGDADSLDEELSALPGLWRSTLPEINSRRRAA